MLHEAVWTTFSKDNGIGLQKPQLKGQPGKPRLTFSSHGSKERISRPVIWVKACTNCRDFTFCRNWLKTEGIIFLHFSSIVWCDETFCLVKCVYTMCTTAITGKKKNRKIKVFEKIAESVKHRMREILYLGNHVQFPQELISGDIPIVFWWGPRPGPGSNPRIHIWAWTHQYLIGSGSDQLV